MYDPEQVELTLFLGGTTQKTTTTTPETTPEKILSLIESNPKITIVEMAVALNMSKEGIMYNIRKMKGTNIKRVGPNKGGHWEILNLE